MKTERKEKRQKTKDKRQKRLENCREKSSNYILSSVQSVLGFSIKAPFLLFLCACQVG